MPTPATLSASLFLLLAATCAPFAAAADLGIDVTRPASCSRPSKVGDSIAVHYRGRLQSTGVEFDQSYNRGSPFVFVLGAGRVIKGWDQGLLDMCPGEARTLTVPPEFGYGHFGAGRVIPPDATLIFETELMNIVGVEQEEPTPATTAVASTASTAATSEAAFAIATAPSTPLADDDYEHELPSVAVAKTTSVVDIAPAATAAAASPMTAQEAEEKAECKLLGSFALFIQGALGVVALMALIIKRWREKPKRPWKVFFFDVSKQIIGSMLTHVLNLAMSEFGANDVVTNAAKSVVTASSQRGGDMPNPCSFYILNLAIDTTIGIPVLYVLLRALHGLFLYTPLARPVESIKSGVYGRPPQWTWWLKQALIYFIGLTGMKLFVWFMFAAMPWLPWVGDWALRWTKGNDALQITFAMFIFPLIMNALQYCIIDSFIMDKSHGGDGEGYERVEGDDDGDEGRPDDGDASPVVVAEDIRGKDADLPAGSAATSLSDGTLTPGSGGGLDAAKKTR